jgi:hypothetical protein
LVGAWREEDALLYGKEGGREGGREGGLDRVTDKVIKCTAHFERVQF